MALLPKNRIRRPSRLLCATPDLARPNGFDHGSLAHLVHIHRRAATHKSVDTRVSIRTRSEQSATSDALLRAVHMSPENWKVVRPCGSQRGSRPHMTPGAVTAWSSSPASDLRPARGPRPGPAQTPPPDPTAAGPGDGRVLSRPSSRVHEPCGLTEAVALRSQTGLTGSGSFRSSYGGFGGGHPRFHPHTGQRGRWERRPRLARVNGTTLRRGGS
jgi:hypothetical protein